MLSVNNMLQSPLLTLASVTTLQIWCWDPGKIRRCLLPAVAAEGSLAAPMGRQAQVTLCLCAAEVSDQLADDRPLPVCTQREHSHPTIFSQATQSEDTVI